MIAKLKALWPGLVGAALSAGVGWFLANTTFGLGLVHLSYDFPFALRETITPTDAVIVYLDDESEERLGQRRDHVWDRTWHAELVNRLSASGAKCVVFDIFFGGATTPEADAKFAEAIKKHGNVVLAANPITIGFDDKSRASGMQIDPPHEPLSEVVADIGSVEMNPDDDSVVRQHLPFKTNDFVKPLAWVAAERAGAPATRDKDTAARMRWINYYGPTRTIPNYSFWRVVSTNADNSEIPAAAFKDKTVFVGGAFQTRLARDRKDEFASPYTFWVFKQKGSNRALHFVPGVEVHTTVFLNLLRGDWLQRSASSTEDRVLVLVGSLLGFFLVRSRPYTATLLAVAAGFGVILTGYYSHTKLFSWFPWAVLLVVVVLAWAWSMLYNSLVLLIQKRLFEQSLALYLSPKLVKKFAGRKDFLKTGAEKQALTILFSDIANFTSLSEGMDGDQLAKLMNGYFDRAIPNCLFKTDGTVMKYIGDAIFAVWNAPDPQPDHAVRACRAALLLRDSLADMKLGEGGPPLRTRIGLHTGVASIGNFGSKERFGYDAVGESINLASRMEGLNKHLGTGVLITGDTHQQTDGQFVTRRLGLFRLKGFEKAVDVYELVSELDQASESQAWREAFAKGVECWERQSLDQAQAAFRRTLEIKPDDGPSKFFLDRLAELKAHPPDGEWDGVVELKEK